MVAAALGTLSTGALGQALPPAAVPGQVDPSLQREQIEQQRRQQQIESRARRVEVPALQGMAPESGDALPPESPPFELSNISFNASVYLSDAELRALAEGYLERSITFADLNELIRQINQRYAELGQLTARAIIPPQTLEDGALRVVLVEAKVDRVDVSSQNSRVRDSFYLERIAVAPGEVLDSPMLIEAIRRFNATSPGPQVTAGLAPGERFGTTRVELETFEPKALGWSLFANNYGNESTGREQYGGSLNWFSPTGVADNLAAVIVGTRGTQYYNLRYARPVTQRNGLAWLEAGTNSLQIKRGPLADLNIEGESTNYGLGFDQPWHLSERWLLLGGAAYTFQTSETTIEGVPLSEIDVQEFALSGQAEYRAAPWYFRYEQRLRQASVDNQVTGDGSNFTLLNGDTYASRQLGERFEAVGKLGWQYATSPEELPSALLMQFGGVSTLRGYDPGIIASPWGVQLSLETHWRLSERWQPYVFLDYGRAMKLGSQDVDLSSAGLGVSMRWGRVSASLVAAAALDEVVPDQDRGKALLQVVIR